MSDTTPPPPTPQEAVAPPMGAPGPQRPRKVGWILGIVGAFVLGIVLGGVGGVVGGATVASIAAGSSATPAAAKSDDPDDTLDTSMPSEEPSAAFSYQDAGVDVKMKTLSKECFGSAGCVLNVEVDVVVDDTSSVPSDASGTLIFEITGGNDGPIQDSIDLSGTSYNPPRETLQTSSRTVTPKIKVTDVTTN